MPMQHMGAPEDPYSRRRVADNLFVDRSCVRVVAPAPSYLCPFRSLFATRLLLSPHAAIVALSPAAPSEYFSSGSYLAPLPCQSSRGFVASTTYM